jgi:hypothetical protein
MVGGELTQLQLASERLVRHCLLVWAIFISLVPLPHSFLKH